MANQGVERPDEVNAPERVEMTPGAYRRYLQEEGWGFTRRIHFFDELLGRLDFALKEPELSLYFYEHEDGSVLMMTEPKRKLGFQLEPVAGHQPPENSTEISLHRYRQVLQEQSDHCHNSFSNIEGLLNGLENSLKEAETSRNIRVTCYRTPKGVEMHVEERGPMGFVPRVEN